MLDINTFRDKIAEHSLGKIKGALRHLMIDAECNKRKRDEMLAKSTMTDTVTHLLNVTELEER